MRKSLLLILFLLTIAGYLKGQPDLSYFLPEEVSYDPAIPTPKSIIGHEVGERKEERRQEERYERRLEERDEGYRGPYRYRRY